MPATSTTTRWYEPATNTDEPTADQLIAVGDRVGVPVELDRSGWLVGAIEVRVLCDRQKCMLVPKSIRVSCDSPLDALIHQGGIVARCQEYNDVIHALRRSLDKFDDAATRIRPSLDVDPDFHASHAALQTGQLVALERLDRLMVADVILLRALDGEIEYLRRCHRFYEAALARVELASPPPSEPTPTAYNPWDEETLDPWDDEPLDRDQDAPE